MIINKLMEQKKLSVYRLAELSGVPYSTVSDLCKGRTKIENCSAKTVFKLAQVLDISVDELIGSYYFKRTDFENFKSVICQRVKIMGDFNFIVDTLERNLVRGYFNIGWEAECFYLIGMIDYLCRTNNYPFIESFNDLRKHKLKKLVLPLSTIIEFNASKDENILNEAIKNGIPEFLRFNIVEGEVRNIA